MPEDKKRYPVEECLMAIRSDPKSPYGFSDDKVFEIFLDTEIKSEDDIKIITAEMIYYRKGLLDKFCEEISKRR